MFSQFEDKHILFTCFEVNICILYYGILYKLKTEKLELRMISSQSFLVYCIVQIKKIKLTKIWGKILFKPK